MNEEKYLEYYSNDSYSFYVIMDDDGKKIGKLFDVKADKMIADDLQQRVLPENIPNLLNVVKVIISAAWQDGKILPSEREAFEKAFQHVNFTKKQRKEIEKEFLEPTPISKLIKHITTRDQKLLILETSFLLVIADNEFHPKEKEFIEYLIREFNLDSVDLALVYRILPQNQKKYIVEKEMHKTLEIKTEEIKTLDKLTPPKKEEVVNHEMVYSKFIIKWNNRRSRYSMV